MAVVPGMMDQVREALVICAPTFFRCQGEPRYSACLSTLAACRQRGFRVVLVDGSPPDVGIAADLKAAGAAVVVHEECPGKGNALRQALRVAGESFPSAQVLAFQELEKTGLVEHYEALVPGLLDADAGVCPSQQQRRWDLCNPARSELSWSSYAVEQVHEEKFQNRLAQLLAQQNGFPFDLDWSFGPFLLRREYLDTWTGYAGQTYDAQWGPMILAFKSNRSLLVGTPVIDYIHSPAMKAEEEGSLDHAMRRLRQLQDCVKAFEGAWQS